MKILLYCPTYTKDDGELALHPETQESINNLIIPEDVTLDIEIDAYNPLPITGISKTDHENTLLKYRKARQKVLSEGYDALLTIEHDMIIPEDALVKMLNTDAVVVYGLYLFRHINPILNALRAVKAQWADMSLSFFPEIVEKAANQGWIECSGAGYGCTLIHRQALERLDFHRTENGHPCSDMPFATDCLREGFKQICRFDVLCGHIKPDGEVLWPSLKGEDYMNENIKIYVFRSFNANIDGRTQHFEEGEESEIPKKYADDFIRAGFITDVRAEPAVKVVRKPKSKPTKAVK
jgi:hypothetical protein